jgi:N-acetyl-alpha-D-muramate 1-phosphate uridylyltransferase
VLKFEAIILCGGKGSRVEKFTRKAPKCLIQINGKPFLYYQLKFLQKNKIKNVIISVGYLSEKVKEYVKKNINFINIKIVDDGKKFLGTGGAIIKSINLLKKNFFVIYGDSYLNFNLKDMKVDNKKSIMAIYKNNNKYDKSNVEIDKSKYILYHKDKSKKKLSYIDYGASFLNKKIFKECKKNVKFDLSSLFQKISKENMLKGFIVKKRFYEIGSYKGINEIKKYLKK